ncbi:recombinase family protein [Streptomyces sp. NBC_00059]|uniref:recombinase family protein n=1 Tax=Streptomyces sp. NBC_00059 TaxID=2975635 RepID=UPI002250ADC7|nr:recombinase family protein [Streptomyces sp. NBC_00059]MCX5412248.1 recombinase family protein [Streptomyces sp. NBC_00059]
MDDVETPATTPYDGCGRCLIGVRRLSRRNEASQSPRKQRDQVLSIVEAHGAHVIGWADDWEVSGAMDPLKRPKLGPWLRGEKGSYDGIAGAAVDRIGRNVRDVLNTAYTIHEKGQILLTADHDGIWDLDDAQQETDLLIKALGAQLEHRAIKKRTGDSKVSARSGGRVVASPSYGYVWLREAPGKPVIGSALHPHASKEIRKVANRILRDQTGLITPNFEMKRLNREGILSPADQLREIYGQKLRGAPWNTHSLGRILTSQAALGYLMHQNKPVLDSNGRPTKIGPELWDFATHLALVEKLTPKAKKTYVRPAGRSSQGKQLYAGRVTCGTCGNKNRASTHGGYQCMARHTGRAEYCKPSPSMKLDMLDAEVTDWFLSEYGHGQVMERIYDSGTNYAGQIAEHEASRARLRQDRLAGLFEDEADREWYAEKYRSLTNDIKELKALPERPAGVRIIPTGKTVAQRWEEATHILDRQEILAEFDVQVILYRRKKGVSQRLSMSALNPYEALLTDQEAAEAA